LSWLGRQRLTVNNAACEAGGQIRYQIALRSREIWLEALKAARL
jgi:hypothetical protein